MPDESHDASRVWAPSIGLTNQVPVGRAHLPYDDLALAHARRSAQRLAARRQPQEAVKVVNNPTGEGVATPP